MCSSFLFVRLSPIMRRTRKRSGIQYENSSFNEMKEFLKNYFKFLKIFQNVFAFVTESEETHTRTHARTHTRLLFVWRQELNTFFYPYIACKIFTRIDAKFEFKSAELKIENVKYIALLEPVASKYWKLLSARINLHWYHNWTGSGYGHYIARYLISKIYVKLLLGTRCDRIF